MGQGPNSGSLLGTLKVFVCELGMRSYFHTGVRLRYAVATNYDLALTFSLGSMEDKWQGMYMFDNSKGSMDPHWRNRKICQCIIIYILKAIYHQTTSDEMITTILLIVFYTWSGQLDTESIAHHIWA